MRSGENQSLLPKENTRDCFPVPPPTLKHTDTCYAAWRELDCMCNDLPLQKQSSFSVTSWPAHTYDICYTPAKWYDRLIFTICCCGDINSCVCKADFCCVCTTLVSVPKLICCSLGITAAFVTGTLGGMYDLVTCAPCRQTMDPIELSQPPIAIESKNEIPENKSFQIENLNSVEDVCKSLDNWIKNDNLPAVISFFANSSHFDLINTSSHINHRRIFLICLAIRFTDEKITLEQRKQFIKSLLRSDMSIITLYNSTEGVIPATLLEALRSDYIYSSELLELICTLGADVHQRIGVYSNKLITNFLQFWACSDFLTTDDNFLFYKLHILYYFENQNRPQNLVAAFREEKPLGELDQKLIAMTDRSVQNLSAGNKWKKRVEIQNYLEEHLVQKSFPKNVAHLIGQYSALYSPKKYRESTTMIECSKVEKSIASLITSQSIIISPVEPKKETMLSKYHPLPTFYQPPPPPPPEKGFSYDRF